MKSPSNCYPRHEPEGAGWCCPRGEYPGDDACDECKAEYDADIDEGEGYRQTGFRVACGGRYVVGRVVGAHTHGGDTQRGAD